MAENENAGTATQEAKVVDLAIRLIFLGLFIYSAIVMVTPLASVVIWAIILSVAIYPLFDWLQAKLGGRKKLATTLLVLVGLAVTLGPIASAVSGFADHGSDFADRAAAGTLQLPAPPENLRDIPVVVISALEEMESVIKCIEINIFSLTKGSALF